MAGRKKGVTKIDSPQEPKNSEILALKASIGQITQERIGAIVGLSRKQIGVRLRGLAKKLSECDDLAVAGDLLRAAVPLAAAVIVGNIADGEYQAAKDLLQHHGLLVAKSETTNRNVPTSKEDALEAIQKFGTQEYDWIREQLRLPTPGPPPADD